MIDMDSIKSGDIIVNCYGQEYYVEKINHSDTYTYPYILHCVNRKTNQEVQMDFTEEGRFYRGGYCGSDIKEVIHNKQIDKKLLTIKAESFGEF